jgi:nickel/cobalt transporter (NicO) family protein
MIGPGTLRRPCARLLLMLIVLAALLLPGLTARESAAHPLGNFTINHYSRLTFSNDRVEILYVLDIAEIPTFEILRRYDVEGDGSLSPSDKALYYDEMVPTLIEYIELTVAGERIHLSHTERLIELEIGDLGLPVLRVELLLEGDLPENWHGAEATYADRTYEGRLGWREIVVRGGPGIVVTDSTAPERGVSDALRDYPEELIETPSYATEAAFRLEPGDGSVDEDDTQSAAGSGDTGGVIGSSRLASVISGERLSPRILTLALLAALVWGAAHALTPGHGKAIVAAYLIGTRGTARHAAFLGLTVTLTHTAGVFALALVTLSLSHFFLPEDLYPWLSVFSGVLVVTIGIMLLYGRTIGQRKAVPSERSVLEHSHGGVSHSHAPPATNSVTFRSLLALGISGGLVPCPSALVILLGAISVQRLELGMLLVLAFSIGLAGVLTGIGLLVVYARWVLRRFSFEPRVPRLLPAASALAISLAGLAILIESLRQAGIV